MALMCSSDVSKSMFKTEVDTVQCCCFSCSCWSVVGIHTLQNPQLLSLDDSCLVNSVSILFINELVMSNKMLIEVEALVSKLLTC